MTDIVECADVWVVQAGNRSSFVLEPLTCLGFGGYVFGQDLDGDCAIEPGGMNDSLGSGMA
jgi:hypothetical protein